MNTAVFQGARRHGCSVREAELLAVYVESEKMEAAAQVLGISKNTAKNHMSSIYLRLAVPHAAAAIAKVLGSFH